jgi:hypothetical protein
VTEGMKLICSHHLEPIHEVRAVTVPLKLSVLLHCSALAKCMYQEIILSEVHGKYADVWRCVMESGLLRRNYSGTGRRGLPCGGNTWPTESTFVDYYMQSWPGISSTRQTTPPCATVIIYMELNRYSV